MIFTAFISFALTMLIEFCLEDGNIFGWYGNTIEKWAKKSGTTKYWGKLLGLCPYCYGTWICLGTALIYSKFDLLTAIYCCGINYLFIEAWKNLLAVVEAKKEAAK